MKKPYVLVFLNRNRLSPRGGPLATGFYINEELQKHKDVDIEFLPDAHEQDASNMCRWILTYIRMFLVPKREKNKFEGYDIIHFHSTKDLYLERRSLKNFDGLVVLTSHSPMPFAQEMFDSMKQKAPKLASSWLLHMLRRADRYSFMRADYIIFPCEEAMEPYFNRWDEFSGIVEKRRGCIRYVATGISPRTALTPSEEIRAKHGVGRDAFLVSFVGRHNEVKGYDLLKNLAGDYLSRHDDSYFIIAGREAPMTGLAHPRWIEVGYTLDPYSYIAASDVFLLPNRETYFDVVAIEALSLGKIIIGSRTGGNRYFERAGLHGVMLYDTLEEAAALLDSVRTMPVEERKRLEADNCRFFQERLSSTAMFDSYTHTLDEIYHKGKAEHGNV